MTRRAYWDKLVRVIRGQGGTSLKISMKRQIYCHPQSPSKSVKQFHYDKSKTHATRELKRISGCRENRDFRKYYFFMSNMTYVRNI